MSGLFKTDDNSTKKPLIRYIYVFDMEWNRIKDRTPLLEELGLRPLPLWAPPRTTRKFLNFRQINSRGIAIGPPCEQNGYEHYEIATRGLHFREDEPSRITGSGLVTITANPPEICFYNSEDLNYDPLMEDEVELREAGGFFEATIIVQRRESRLRIKAGKYESRSMF